MVLERVCWHPAPRTAPECTAVSGNPKKVEDPAVFTHHRIICNIKSYRSASKQLFSNKCSVVKSSKLKNGTYRICVTSDLPCTRELYGCAVSELPLGRYFRRPKHLYAGRLNRPWLDYRRLERIKNDWWMIYINDCQMYAWSLLTWVRYLGRVGIFRDRAASGR